MSSPIDYSSLEQFGIYDRQFVEALWKKGVEEAASPEAADLMTRIIKEGVKEAARRLKKIKSLISDLTLVDNTPVSCNFCHAEFSLLESTIQTRFIACENCVHLLPGPEEKVSVDMTLLRNFVSKHEDVCKTFPEAEPKFDIVVPLVHKAFKKHRAEDDLWHWTRAEEEHIFYRPSFMQRQHHYFLDALEPLDDSQDRLLTQSFIGSPTMTENFY